MHYYDTLHDEIKAYFAILSPIFPAWLHEYIDTQSMLRLAGSSMNCGTDYTKLYHNAYWYSNLDHSIGVALIIWHFTHDKKQTLAGLFHDIATPVFKHCIDFMNGDSERQESTEEKTIEMIKNSKEIMALLKRDGILLEEISNYHIYPLADNDTPRLSADRFEYTFSSGLVFKRVWDLDSIQMIYQNICIVKNEDNIDELAFQDIAICEKYIHVISKLWPEWICDKNRTSMQFIADIVSSMICEGYLSIDDLYILSETDVIDKILSCSDSYLKDSFIKFQKCTTCYGSENFVHDKYCVSVNSKRRYIVPLVCTPHGIYRIDKISRKANEDINQYLNYRCSKYTGLDFDFKPYVKK